MNFRYFGGLWAPFWTVDTQTHRGQAAAAGPAVHAGNSHPVGGLRAPPLQPELRGARPKAERAERSERSTSRVFRCRILPSAGRGRLAAKVARLAREVTSSARKVMPIGSMLAATCPICSCSRKNSHWPCGARRGRGWTKPKRAPPLLSPQVGYLVIQKTAGE